MHLLRAVSTFFKTCVKTKISYKIISLFPISTKRFKCLFEYDLLRKTIYRCKHFDWMQVNTFSRLINFLLLIEGNPISREL